MKFNRKRLCLASLVMLGPIILSACILDFQPGEEPVVSTISSPVKLPSAIPTNSSTPTIYIPPTPLQTRPPTAISSATSTIIRATDTPKGYECVQHLAFNPQSFERGSYDASNPPLIETSLVAKQGDDFFLLSSLDGSIHKIAGPIPPITLIPCFDDLEFISPCKSPDGRFMVWDKPAAIEGGSAVIEDFYTDRTLPIPGSFSYTAGRSTFAWSPDSQELYYARVDGLAGFFKVDLIHWQIEALLPACSDMPFYGAVNPYILADGRVIFVLQGMEADQYPPPGVYIYEEDQSFRRIAEIPVLEYEYCDLNPECYGTFSISPEGDWFIYYARAAPKDTPPRNSAVLLGSINTNQVWDLASIFGDVETIQWIEDR